MKKITTIVLLALTMVSFSQIKHGLRDNQGRHVIPRVKEKFFLIVMIMQDKLGWALIIKLFV